jgi:hypothetical protein
MQQCADTTVIDKAVPDALKAQERQNKETVGGVINE